MTEESRHIQIENHVLMQEITRMFNEMHKQSVTITVRGYSMRPFLEDRRDKVILTPPRTPGIGDVVLARIGDRSYALHRIIKIDNGTYTMQGDGNPLSMKEQFTQTDIIGVADAFIRKGRHITTNSFKWRTYSFAWRILKPIRRILLGVLRRL